MLAENLLKTKSEYKSLKKRDIQNIFIKANKIKLVFSMTWLMEIFRINLEVPSQGKYYVIKTSTQTCLSGFLIFP